MQNKLKMTFDHIYGEWKYDGHMVYDLQNDDGSPLLRVAVWIEDIDGEYGNLKVNMVTFKLDGPLPDGIGLFKYLHIFDVLEKQKILSRMGPEFLDTSIDYLDVPLDYLIVNVPELHKLSSSPEDPDCQEEIAKWLENFLVKDGILDKFKSILESVRTDSVSVKKKLITHDFRGNPR